MYTVKMECCDAVYEQIYLLYSIYVCVYACRTNVEWVYVYVCMGVEKVVYLLLIGLSLNVFATSSAEHHRESI